MIHRSLSRAKVLAALVGAGIAACVDHGVPTAPPPRPASITVNVAMVGNGADSDGFVVRIGSATLSFAGAGTEVDSTVATGPQDVELSGLAGNCAADTTSAFVTVSDTTHATVSFTVECYGGFAYTSVGANDTVTVKYLDETGRISRLFPGPAPAGVTEWSPDGAYALVAQSPQGVSNYWVVARNGGFTRQLPAPGVQALSASFSPDGSQILYTRLTPGAGFTQLRLTDVQGTFDRAVLSDGASFFNGYGSWSPDGSHIAYVSTQFNGQLSIASVRADGSGSAALSTQTLSSAGATGWSPDGQYVAAELSMSSPVLGSSLVLFPATGGPFIVPLANPFLFENTSDFSWSPDGTRLAMTRHDPDALRVVVVNRDGSQPVVVAPGLLYSDVASWSADGARILFIGALASSGGQQWIFVAHPDGTHLHPVVEGASLAPNQPIWNRAAKPGMRDR